MVALTADRNTTARLGDTRAGPLAAAVKVWAGSIVMRNAAGLLTKGATATGGVGARFVFWDGPRRRWITPLVASRWNTGWAASSSPIRRRVI